MVARFTPKSLDQKCLEFALLRSVVVAVDVGIEYVLIDIDDVTADSVAEVVISIQ